MSNYIAQLTQKNDEQASHMGLPRFLKHRIASVFQGGVCPKGLLRPATRLLIPLVCALAITAGNASAQANGQSTSTTETRTERVGTFEDVPTTRIPITEHGLYLKRLQDQFGDLSDTPIIVMDKDAIDFRHALMRDGNDDQLDRLKVIWNFVQERANTPFPPNVLNQLNRRLNSSQPEAYLIWTASEDGRPSKPLCFVFPSSPSTTAYYDIARLLSIANATDEPIMFRPGLQVTKNEIRSLFDYHEIAHCLDERYRMLADPRFNDDLPSQVVARHKEDMLGDVFSGLMNARKGNTQAPYILADIRTVLADLLIPVQFENLFYLDREHWSDHYLAGQIYYTTPGLKAVQAVLEDIGVDGLREMNAQEVLDLAYEIVEENALTIDQIMQLGNYQHFGRDQYVENANRNSNPGPELLADSLVFGDAFEAEVASARDRIIVPAREAAIAPASVSTTHERTIRKIERLSEMSCGNPHSIMQQIVFELNRRRGYIRNYSFTPDRSAEYEQTIDALFAVNTSIAQLPGLIADSRREGLARLEDAPAANITSQVIFTGETVKAPYNTWVARCN